MSLLGLGGRIIVRIMLHDGSILWRYLDHFDDLTDHGKLCRIFNLDPVSTSFDLPSSARGIGSYQSGYGPTNRSRTIDGYILRNKEPIGRLRVAHESEKFRDVDPTELWR
jgi:hypothetical protein